MEHTQKSVVKVAADKVYYSYAQPGTVIRKYSSRGSGFCYHIPGLKGNSDGMFIMTNAHCVDSAQRITVYRQGESRLYPAEVVAIGYECDMAILRLTGKAADVKRFYKDMQPLKLGRMPNKLDKVYVYGFPLSGMNVSITKGVVNRISIVPYFNASENITLQIDAPINFGNSGGPVTNADGDLVGIAFYGEDDSTTQNMGYIIPTVLMDHFVKRVKRFGKYTGNSGLGIDVQEASNSSMRDYYNITPSQTGVFISYVNPFGSGGADVLRKGDFVTKINGYNIDNDGSVNLRDVILSTILDEDERREFNESFALDERVHMNSLPSLLLPGEKCSVDIVRDGKPKSLDLKIQVTPLMVPVLPYQQPPSYYVVGGLVFMPVSIMLIEEKAKREYIHNMIEASYTKTMRYPDQQVIVLSSILQSELTASYDTTNSILHTVNGREPRNLEHLREIVESEMKAKKRKFLIFSFADSPDEIIIRSGLVKKYTTQLVRDQMGLDTVYSNPKEM